jgi:hypothetical protein
MPLNQQNFIGLPNYPNYRLGPIDESSCDSLNIDNLPIANFRFEVDSLNPLQVNFINLSYFNPDSFSWDFDDGNQSELKDISHIYSGSGNYEVCLTATNSYGVNTFCRNVPLILSSDEEVENKKLFSIYPNPVIGSELRIKFSKTSIGPGKISLFNVVGKEILKLDGISNEYTIDISSFPSGLYYFSIDLNTSDPFVYPIMILN